MVNSTLSHEGQNEASVIDQEDFTANLWFLKRLALYQETKPYMITFDPVNLGVDKTNHAYELHAVTPIDCRPHMDTFKLDTQGFELLTWNTELQPTDFDDDGKIERIYYPEVLASFQRTFPQFCHIHVFAHLVSSHHFSRDARPAALKPPN